MDYLIIEAIKNELDGVNPYVHCFRSLRNKIGCEYPRDLKMRILYDRYKDPRQYNRPTTNKATELLVGKGSMENSNRDIILETV